MIQELDILFDKTVTCNLCSKTYTTKKVRSRFIKNLQMDSDFCTYYMDEENSPLLYYVCVCPSCGYSTTEEFSTYFPPSTRDEIKNRISSNWSNNKYSEKRLLKDAIETYKLGIYCATLKKEKHIVLAGLYIRLAWLLRKKSYHEQEQRFLKLAVLEYVQSYSKDEFKHTDMSELKILYLIGDLFRRIGDQKQAILYLC